MDCNPRRMVFSETQFRVMMFVVSVVCGFCCGVIGGRFCMCTRCVKFGMCCRHFRDFVKRASGRYGNVSCKSSKFGWLFVINKHSFLWIVLGGLIRSWLFSLKF
jgi:hypothetical protein